MTKPTAFLLGAIGGLAAAGVAMAAADAWHRRTFGAANLHRYGR